MKTLFVDDSYIENKHEVTRVVHPLVQHKDNPLILQDRPWECHTDCRWHPSVCMWSNSVIRDPLTGVFRMWYTGYADKDEVGRETSLMLYAESMDGLNWTKPNLGIVEWKDSKENNIVLVGITDGVSDLRLVETPNVIYNPNEPDPKLRYRLLTSHYYQTDSELIDGVWLYASEDGLHWEMLKPDAVPNGREFNSFFWDERTQKYIGTVRVRNPRVPRHVGYTQSSDSFNWTQAETIISPEDLNSRFNLPGDDVYGLCSFPYESHYIGFLHTHHADRRLEVQLMSSIDGRSWRFVGDGEYILPNDPPGGYGQGMMSTQNGPPVRVGDKLWIYIGMSPKAHNNPDFKEGPGQQKRVIGLTTLRLDGFASLKAGESCGFITTKPFWAAGDTLTVNANAGSGILWVEVLGKDGKQLPGLTAEDCIPVTGDGTAHEVHWRSASIPVGNRIKLRFYLRKAEIYCWSMEGSYECP